VTKAVNVTLRNVTKGPLGTNRDWDWLRWQMECGKMADDQGNLVVVITGENGC